MNAINDEKLVIVGTGIRATGQLTIETIAHIKRADKVLYLTADPVAEELIKALNPKGAESLKKLYGENKLRTETYREIVSTVMALLREGHRVCVAIYGHPGVFATSMHQSINQARAEGFKARMLPAVSAEDCMFADLGIDPVSGCSCYEATEFLLNVRLVDPASHLILWQIGGLGDPTYKSHNYELKGLVELTKKLMGVFGAHHTVTLYEAPQFPGVEPLIQSGALHLLAQQTPTPNSTLYIAPISQAIPDYSTRQALGTN